MAKAILEFDLSDPNDAEDYKRAVKSTDLARALWDIDQYLRTQTKYNDSLATEAYQALDKARDEFYSILNRYGILFDEL